jgi:hypothetical protein
MSGVIVISQLTVLPETLARVSASTTLPGNVIDMMMCGGYLANTAVLFLSFASGPSRSEAVGSLMKSGEVFVARHFSWCSGTRHNSLPSWCGKTEGPRIGDLPMTL